MPMDSPYTCLRQKLRQWFPEAVSWKEYARTMNANTKSFAYKRGVIVKFSRLTWSCTSVFRNFFKKTDNNPALILSETSPSWVEGKATEAEEIEDGEENKEQQIICLMSPEQKYVWAMKDWPKSTGGWADRSIWKCGV